MGKSTITDEQTRAASLRSAETRAVNLFNEISRTLVRPGITEAQLSAEIHALGAARHGVRTHWHKRVVRSGPNTLSPFDENPPDRTIAADDILVIDLGPVFQEWEADFGRTYVLGEDERKRRLRDALEPMWWKVKGLWEKEPEMSGERLYGVAKEAAEEEGWTWGAEIAGHIVGDFPHERIPRDKVSLYITPGNGVSMGSKGGDGNRRHWILEIHLRDPSGEFGGFFEQILTVD